MEQYSWRDEEKKLNESVPQFRTSFLLPGLEGLQRLHFIHARSPHANAVPLLLIPPFPFTNLSLSHLIPLFTDPEDAGAEQPFHLVIPSLPGLGFSDRLPDNSPLIAKTAEMFDMLMGRLGYGQYIATNSSSAADSPAQIDWKLANRLSVHHRDSCVGVHFISPVLRAPKLKQSPMAWVKWRLAKAMNGSRWGYAKEDFAAIRDSKQQQQKPAATASSSAAGQDPMAEHTLGTLAVKEPNALAYALCDSPTGLLLFMLTLLRAMGSRVNFSPAEILTLIGWTWLPGPEGMLRYWAHCCTSIADETATQQSSTQDKNQAEKEKGKPEVSITAFTGGDDTQPTERGANEEQRQNEDDNNGNDPHTPNISEPSTRRYICPQWAGTKYRVLSAHRAHGRPGLLAWERPDIILRGTRSLASALLATRRGGSLRESDRPGQALLEQVVVVDGTGGGALGQADISGTTVQAGGGSSAAGSPRKPLSPMPPKGGEKHLDVPGQPQKQQSSPLRPVMPPRGSTPQKQSPDHDPEGSEEAVSSPDTVIALPPSSNTLGVNA